VEGSSSSVGTQANPIVLDIDPQFLEETQDEEKDTKLVLEVVEEENAHSPSALHLVCSCFSLAYVIMDSCRHFS
jgi:hypothetical protein